MRTVWSALPRSRASFDVGKILTRTVLRPSSAPCPTRIVFGGRVALTVDVGSLVGNDLYCLDDHYEAVTLELWRHLARRAAVILDIGSHIGTFALVAAHENPQARTLCVEAHPAHAERMRHHAQDAPNVTAVEAAIAPPGASRWLCEVSGNDGAAYLADAPQASAPKVETQTLAELCRRHGLPVVDLVKLDVEGLEHQILSGEDEFFARHAPRDLIVEMRVPKARVSKDASRQAFAAMERRGYVARRVQGLYAWPFFKDHDLANWHFHKVGADDRRLPPS